ncbi:hypothetical protein CU669_08715 [Paramagnetospirillum kuznetsovii]|uniref:DUF2232 domain-containing protein n=1 Tax=Paramagnetospirillum kuznetsovii TaxID=2053833 RepID=A0A364NZ77_9PROT|nr:DUF2232 domain-containing protein [Paramagnetospirillum kuznetsovii]RAU22205.1 hypothetical protein CU669_08715 [Paramagnetospirillum kuznetsovii]
MTGSIGISLAAGLLSSVLFLALAKGIAVGMLLSYLAPLPLMMAGLNRGTTAALVAGSAAMAAVALGVGGIASLPFAITAVLPALVVVRQSLLWRGNADGSVEWYPPGLVLAWLTGMGLALILIGAAFVPGQTDSGELVGIQDWVSDAVGRTFTLLAPSLTVEQRHAAIGWWVPFFPAMVAGSWLIMAVVNATLAQGFLARLGKSQRPTPAYRELELPLWLGVALPTALAVGAMVEGDLGYLARNMAVVTVVPFVLLGLAVMHEWVARRPNARLLLAVTYGVLFLASAWAIFPVAGLGLARFVTRFRRTAESGGGKED